MPDFSFPAWILRESTFADSLAKGAQVGSMIANTRYRNQALAASVVQNEREFELRERQLASHTKTADLNYQLQSRMIEDQAADKATITSWLGERSKLPLEERLNSPYPDLRLPQSYQIANTIVDNDRMAYESSTAAKLRDSLAARVGKLPADFQARYITTEDPNERLSILEAGEEASRTATLDLYQPREMTTSEGEKVFYNPKSGTFRFAPSPITDEVTTRPITDETGKVIGHAMRSGDKWVRIPEDEGGNQLEVIRYRKLADDLSDIRKMKAGPFGSSPTAAPSIRAQEDAILKEMKDIESRLGTSGAAPTSSPSAVRKYNPDTGKIE